jgi:putative energy coupling factor transporter S component
MSKNIRKITLSAMAAAVVFVVTLLVKFPIPGTNGGYVNLGDTVIFISAYMLGGPIAAVSSAVGSTLADLVGGAAIYMPATFVIKGLMGLIFGLMAKNRHLPTYIIACIVCGGVMTLGYALYETAVFGFPYAIGAVPYNLLQWGGSTAAAIALYPAAKRLSSTTLID